MPGIMHILHPMAHKPHTCDYCHRIIKVGEKYEKTVWADDGAVHTWRTCQQCHNLLEKYPLEDDGDGIDNYDFYDHVSNLCNERGLDNQDMDAEEMVCALLKEKK